VGEYAVADLLNKLILLIVVLYLVLSGSVKKFINRILTARKLKAGLTGIEVEGVVEKEDSSKVEPPPVENRTTHRRKTDVCASHAELVKLCERNSEDLAKFLARTEKMEAHISELWISQLKRGFYSRDMPLAERLLDGLRYVWQGHNGEARKDVIQAAKENLDIYRVIVHLHPEYALEGVEDM
jgi:hypothetical protein